MGLWRCRRKPWGGAVGRGHTRRSRVRVRPTPRAFCVLGFVAKYGEMKPRSNLHASGAGEGGDGGAGTRRPRGRPWPRRRRRGVAACGPYRPWSWQSLPPAV